MRKILAASLLGLGAGLGVDPNVVRLAFLVLALANGAGGLFQVNVPNQGGSLAGVAPDVAVNRGVPVPLSVNSPAEQYPTGEYIWNAVADVLPSQYGPELSRRMTLIPVAAFKPASQAK